ncbi:hypothetical protein SAMN02910456_00464 [Ruminococcaceae bacterium YRB3002]|nr:hypothetical protein SAMN02910456_00464 [Ruminococcaceae bacterium YRB3002]
MQNKLVLLQKEDAYTADRGSSKGNQLKWMKDGVWYKADNLGYEGLSEYVVSRLLAMSSLGSDEFITYEVCRIRYNTAEFNGCSCRHFLKPYESLITLERLFKDTYSHSFYESVYMIADHEERLRFIVNSIADITHMDNIGAYIAKLLTIDALFLNEDRHLHNIALIKGQNNEYRLSPVFDNGASLLSDTKIDYPVGEDVFKCIGRSRPKTFCDDYDEQVDLCEKLYGRQISFGFDWHDVKQVLSSVEYYPDDVKERVYDTVLDRRRKYKYLFK